jgi:hypothetical protein
MKLPKRVFVKWDDSDTEPFLVVEEDMEQLATDVGGSVDVGCYELTSTGKLATKTEFAADKRRAHEKNSLRR